jgi:glycosyltransferase involved in cell wall biosynthesis
VLSYTIKPVIYGTIAAAIAGVPQRAAMITGLGYAFLAGGVARRATRVAAIALYRLALHRANIVFFQNADDQALFAELGLISYRNRVELLRGSGVDVGHFTPVPRPNRPSFLMIARLVADKGVREYVEAARIVRRRCPDAMFRCVGTLDPNPASVRAPELQAWISEGTVDFLGELADVRPAIADALVYVLPSYREGMPRTVLEAMAMGRAVITSDAPGCRQTIVAGESGLLVPVRDPDALAAAMIRFIEEPGLAERLGDAARQRVVEMFDVNEVSARIIGALSL